MSRIAFLSLLLVVGWSVPMMGCGDDEPQAATRGRGGRRAKTTKKKKTAETADGVDQSRLPAKLRNIDWKKDDKAARPDRQSRDPFVPIVDDLIDQMIAVETENEKPDKSKRRRVSAFNVEELSLMAIVTGTAVHRAMLTDPNGLGHVIRTGDVVGRDVPYRVSRITRNEAIFKPLTPPTDENQPKEIRKALRSNDELEELQ